MNLSIDRLQQMGAFAPVELVKETVTWMQDGETLEATVYVRPLSCKSGAAEIDAMRRDANPYAGRIAASICRQDGTPVFSIEDVVGDSDPEKRGPMRDELFFALLDVINRANGLGKHKSHSATKKSSGTSSSSTALAETPSPKPSSD